MSENKTWPQLIEEVAVPFKDIAKSHNAVQWVEECEFAKQAVQKNSMLAECKVQTVQNAIKNVAAIGLTLNPAYGYAYLIPESKKNGNQWAKECDLRISFTGLIKLATDSGAIKKVRAEIVRQNDEFIFNGVFNEPTHRITTPFDEAQRGAPIGVYCVAIDNEDKYTTELMSWDEVLKIKSKAKTQNVWNEWTNEMAKKAIIKRASKQWTKTNRMESAVSMLNETEGSVDIGAVPDDIKVQFDHALNNATAIEFYGFIKSLPEDQYDALYNSGEKGKKMDLKKMFTEKEKAGIQQINELVHDMRSDDEETKEDAVSAMQSKTDLEKNIVRKFMQENKS